MGEIVIKILDSNSRELLNRVAEDVFDHELNTALSAEFLSDPRHHLAVAIREDQMIGFASAVHYVHPDKPAELWINAIGVAPANQGLGIGTGLMKVLFNLGVDLGCQEAWVLADADNEDARRFYKALGGAETPSVMYSYHLKP